MAKATVAKKYSKTKFTLYYNYEGKSKENYAELVGAAVYGLGRASTKKHGKHLVAVYYDHTDVTPAELSKTTESLLLKRGLYQVEQPSDTSSNNRTIGIIYADVLSYLAS